MPNAIYEETRTTPDAKHRFQALLVLYPGNVGEDGEEPAAPPFLRAVLRHRGGHNAMNPWRALHEDHEVVVSQADFDAQKGKLLRALLDQMDAYLLQPPQESQLPDSGDPDAVRVRTTPRA